jgi:RNA polymerase sigma-70 factor (ECF subfamily)
MKESAVEKTPDEKIVKLCQKNSREGFEMLFDRYRRYVYTICRRSTRHEQDALDLTQEVLWKIVRGIGGFDSKKPLTPWIRKITVNCCINHARDKEREREYPVDFLDPACGIPEAVDEDLARSPERHRQTTEDRQRIGKALASLPGRERTAIILRHMEDRSYAEIAKLMDAPEGSVKTWIFRGRRMLKKELEDMQVWSI